MGTGRGEVEEFDVIVVGGGPAGSVCARTLVDSGRRVALLDRQSFPRVKLCAGWVSAPIWDVIEVRPDAYPRGLWPWGRCHVHYDGADQTVVASGHFIRRYEFDEFLLRRSGATVVEIVGWSNGAIGTMSPVTTTGLLHFLPKLADSTMRIASGSQK